MLEETIKKQLASYVALLEHDVVMRVSVDESDKAQELKHFVEEVVALSPKLSIQFEKLKRTPSFTIDRQDQATGISFAAIPLGHELSSFVLALVQAGGRAPKIDDTLKKRIQAIEGQHHFETYMSLSCHICPDVVQALNIMAILNPNISHDVIDGALFQEEIEAKDIMAVPTVFHNQESFAAGRMTLEEIVDLLVGSAEIEIDASVPYDVFVIGGGPAGASAAIYAARKGLKVGIVSDRIGGQVLETFSIENLIGTPYTEGPKLAASLENHMREYPIDTIKNMKVKALEKQDAIHVIFENGQRLVSKTVIIATGARWRNVNVPGEQELKNKGVAYCPHCDGPLFKDKHVGVIGGGNSGIEAAIDLAGIAKKVTVFEFMDTLKADDVLQKRIHSLSNVDVLTNVETKEILGASHVTGLRYEQRDTQESQSLDLDGVFVQIGLIPNTEWLQDTLELSSRGEILVDKHGATSMAGVFAAGDCTDSAYKQIIISMGSGATAALGAFDALIRQ